jgi:hypothetical protein
MSSQNVQYGKNVTLFFISLPFAERQQVNLLRCTTQYRAKRTIKLKGVKPLE